MTVPLAEPLKDANGNVVQDLEGRTTPRYTTIYDAAAKLYVQQPATKRKIPIPTLVPPAAHEAGRGLPAVRGADLRAETRQARGRAQAAAGVPAPGEETGWKSSP